MKYNLILAQLHNTPVTLTYTQFHNTQVVHFLIVLIFLIFTPVAPLTPVSYLIIRGIPKMKYRICFRLKIIFYLRAVLSEMYQMSGVVKRKLNDRLYKLGMKNHIQHSDL